MASQKEVWCENFGESGQSKIINYPRGFTVSKSSKSTSTTTSRSFFQIYLDLRGFRGRGEEAADVLYERIVDKLW